MLLKCNDALKHGLERSFLWLFLERWGSYQSKGHPGSGRRPCCSHQCSSHSSAAFCFSCPHFIFSVIRFVNWYLEEEGGWLFLTKSSAPWHILLVLGQKRGIPVLGGRVLGRGMLGAQCGALCLLLLLYLAKNPVQPMNLQ